VTLARYSDSIGYPDGSLALNVPISILMPDGTTPAVVYGDTGQPLSNPVTTDSRGDLTFLAAEGEYLLLPPWGGQAVRVRLAAPAGPAFTYTQVPPATTWTVPHGLGRHPELIVRLADGRRVLPDATDIDLNTVVLSWANLSTGTVECY
jgi:hypothetical protein